MKKYLKTIKDWYTFRDWDDVINHAKQIYNLLLAPNEVSKKFTLWQKRAGVDTQSYEKLKKIAEERNKEYVKSVHSLQNINQKKEFTTGMN